MIDPIPVPHGPAALGRRILGFAAIPFLSLLAPFLFLPVLARIAGADAWVAIALGQSVGGFAALIVSLGYPTLAPPQVATADPERRRRILATSLHARVPLFVVACIGAVFVASLIAPDSHRVEAGLMAGVFSLAGLASTWYWIGVGRALPILWTEVVPRMVATLAATGILLAGGPVIWYPILLGIAMLAGPAVVAVRVAGAELLRVDRADIAHIFRQHPPALIAESAAGAYNALAVTLVTAIAPVSQAARYVAGDKIYRIGQYSVSALGNALQGWVAEASVDARELGRRLRVTIMLHGGLGLLGFLAFWLLGPWLTTLLFGATVAIDTVTALGFGVATVGISLGTAFGRIGLITLEARKTFMVCVLISSALGVGALLLGGGVGGAAGAAWGLGLAELFSGTLQGVVLLVLWRGRSASVPPVS